MKKYVEAVEFEFVGNVRVLKEEGRVSVSWLGASEVEGFVFTAGGPFEAEEGFLKFVEEVETRGVLTAEDVFGFEFRGEVRVKTETGFRGSAPLFFEVECSVFGGFPEDQLQVFREAVEECFEEVDEEEARWKSGSTRSVESDGKGRLEVWTRWVFEDGDRSEARCVLKWWDPKEFEEKPWFPVADVFESRWKFAPVSAVGFEFVRAKFEFGGGKVSVLEDPFEVLFDEFDFSADPVGASWVEFCCRLTPVVI